MCWFKALLEMLSCILQDNVRPRPRVSKFRANWSIKSNEIFKASCSGNISWGFFLNCCHLSLQTLQCFSTLSCALLIIFCYYQVSRTIILNDGKKTSTDYSKEGDGRKRTNESLFLYNEWHWWIINFKLHIYIWKQVLWSISFIALPK